MIGTKIADLKIIQLLGGGEMGAVYLAEHELANAPSRSSCKAAWPCPAPPTDPPVRQESDSIW